MAAKLARHFGDTPIGRASSLEEVTDARSFIRTVPRRSYEEHVPFFGTPAYWGVTTGTTGGQKAIPFNRRFLKANGEGFNLFLGCVLLDLGTLAPVLGRYMYLGSCEPLKRGEDGVLRGSSMAISDRESPAIFRNRGIPGTQLDELPTWDAKMDRLVEIARKTDVRTVLGMPPWLLSFAEHVETKLGITNLHDLWPNLRILIVGGTFVEPYQQRLDTRFDPVTCRTLYGATEGLLGFQDGPEEALLPSADTLLYEFVPVDELESANPTRHLLVDVELDVEYAIHVSTLAGLLSYPVGDTVRFVSRNPHRFLVTGRVKQRANVAGEKVTMGEVERAAILSATKLGLTLNEVLVVPLSENERSGRPRHRWFVETETRDGTRRADLAATLDAELSGLSETYRVRRQGERPAMDPPVVYLLSPGAFDAWLREEGMVGAQHKVPRILDSVPDIIASKVETNDLQSRA